MVPFDPRPLVWIVTRDRGAQFRKVEKTIGVDADASKELLTRYICVLALLFAYIHDIIFTSGLYWFVLCLF